MLGDLSSKYESNGNPATVSGGEGDAGGVSYGCYQFASNMGVPQKFVQWCCSYPDEALANYGKVLSQYQVNSEEFIDTWETIGNTDPYGFFRLQHEYTKECYYDSGVQELKNRYGFDIEQRSDALKDVLWSACVQFGSYYGAINFGEAADLFGSNLDSMDDKDIIYYIYEKRLIDESYSSGSPSLRPGLFARWRSEREDALGMLA